ncbi:Glycosyltransferase involved in cell wall bisynthesis [Cnuella takakiae]|uniref:Glycosyltransferase involved in cell wall bisynthesis n=1 Tax=Cnuella takakiae TaxID=1302690 RepID=A0A1M5CKB8_9BACT|nr:glycosyltransferase [Cnuella takakiae]OLY91859.1 glycosyl transferase family 1 [Cnuella takakiae]SHF55194.1 Glycosyltransferase involved in cell wall bisynthesis [Cnuella takakiae]
MNQAKILGRDIIIVGQQPWDTSIGSNCKDIAIELSKHNRVLYVNSPLDRITSIKHKKQQEIQKRINIINKSERGLYQINNNLWNLYPDCLVESINWLNSTFIFDFINKRNNKIFSKSIINALQELNFKDYILFNDNELIKCFYLKDLLGPSISIYYSRDYILATDYWKKHGTRLEPLLISKSDICVTNSIFLQEYCSRYNPNSFYVGQGCDFSIFQVNTVSSFKFLDNIKEIKRPIVGYVGSLLSSRLDLSLIEYIVKDNPNYSFVFVGPEDDDFKTSLLHEYKNVFFLGAKSLKELPSIIDSFDVCINPQVINQLTIGNYPRKVDEYLLMGKPVVATATKTMELFNSVVYLANSKFSFSTLIQQALVDDNNQLSKQRVAFASEHTWETSVNQIYKAIYSHLEKNNTTHQNG